METRGYSGYHTIQQVTLVREGHVTFDFQHPLVLDCSSKLLLFLSEYGRTVFAFVYRVLLYGMVFLRGTPA